MGSRGTAPGCGAGGELEGEVGDEGVIAGSAAAGKVEVVVTNVFVGRWVVEGVAPSIVLPVVAGGEDILVACYLLYGRDVCRGERERRSVACGEFTCFSFGGRSLNEGCGRRWMNVVTS